MRAECALIFQDVKTSIVAAGSERKQILEKLDQIHDTVTGTNGRPGIGEKFRSIDYGQKRQDKMLSELQDRVKGAGWRLWQKIAAVVIVLCAISGTIIQLARVL